MSPVALLVLYCILISLSSIGGGLVPLRVRLTHRRMEIALSFVAGVMLGVAILHLLPHAVAQWTAGGAGDGHGHPHGHDVEPVMAWLIGGFVAMFLIERYFCFHQHDAPHAGGPPGPAASAGVGEGVRHRHGLTWGGAAVGLTLHTLIAGIALAASVESEHKAGIAWSGLGTFFVIVLHKPFDALTIATLMTAGGHSTSLRHWVNALFSLVIPLGAGLFVLGLAVEEDGGGRLIGGALAFSAGTFLCISLSDLLPELRFHHHDRAKLSAALLLGLGLAGLLVLLEGNGGPAAP